MADKVAKRGVSIYIDGAPVMNSVKGITSEMRKLSNEQAKMTIGADDYVAHGQKIGYLKSILNEHKDKLADIASQYANNTKGLDGFLNRMSELPGAMGWIGRSLTGVGDTIEMLFKNKLMLGASVLAVVGTAVVALVKHSMEFAKSVSELSALTGATGKDLDYLKDKAIDLAKEYGKSAVEIVVAMKLVGSAKPELLSNVSALSDVTQSVLTLSKATGMDLTESTKAVTTIMNQFGLSAIESDRTINVLAAGSKYGAVEVDYLGESVSKVGTIAKSANLTLEQTVAVMELFGEKGVKAETAGTGFKGVLVKLQADTKNYTNGLFDLNKAIDNNQSIAGDNIELQKRFGTEFFGLAQILFQNKTRFEELNKQVTGTGVAMEQMLIATDNLSGDVEKMTSSWDAFLLSLENGKGPMANASRWLVQMGTFYANTFSSWSKDAAQNEEAAIEKSTKVRIDSMKKLMPGQKDQLKYINEKIEAERRIYQRDQERMKQLQAEIELDKKNKAGLVSVIKPKQDFLDVLSLSVKKSIAYTNALGGLRSGFKLAPKPAGTETKKPGTGVDVQKESLDELDKWISSEQIKFKKRHLDNLDSEEVYQQNMINVEREGLVWKQVLYDKNSKEYLDAADKIATIDLKRQDEAEKLKLKSLKTLQDERLNAIVIYDNQLREELNQNLDNGIITQDQYDNSILALDKTLAEARLDAAQEHARDLLDFQFKSDDEKLTATLASNKAIEEAQKAQHEAEKKILKKGISDKKEIEKSIVEIEKKYGINTFKDKRKEFNDDLQVLKEAHAKELAEIIKNGGNKEKAIKRYETDVAKIKLAKAEQLAQDIADIANAASNLSASLQEAETMAVDNKYAKQLKAAKAAGQDTTALETQIEEEKKAIKKKYADVDFAINVAKIIAETALQVIKAGANIPLAILMGVMGAAQIAVAVQQRAAVQNLWTGTTGFTPNVGKYTPTGIVHGGEFVGAMEAVQNPNLRPVFDVINEAQKNGTVSKLTKEQLSKALRMSPTYSDSNSSGSHANTVKGSEPASTVDYLSAVVSAVNRLNDHLDKGIDTRLSISGENGVAKKLDDYNKLINNGKR